MAGPISYLEPMGGGGGRPRDPFANPPAAAAASRQARQARPYDDVPAITPEEAQKIQGLLQAEQHKAIYEQALRDAAKPAMFMFNKAGNVAGSLDQNKRMGYGALASLLGADADRYSEDNRANMFQQDLQQQGELARMPYEQMTAADEALSDFRGEELKQRSEIARMPYEKMTPYEEGTLDVERMRSMGRDPLIDAFAPNFQNDPEVMEKIRARIMGEDYQPQSPQSFRQMMGEKVLNNEVQDVLRAEFGDTGPKTLDDYRRASRVHAETLFEQFEDADRSFDSVLKEAEAWDRESPGGMSVKLVKQMHANYIKGLARIQRKRRELADPDVGIPSTPFGY